jgi:hypothetical protein
MRWLLSAVLLLCACDKTTLVVESDTSWAGSVGDSQVADRGDQRFELPDAKQEICWSIAKTTSAGTLRAYAEDDTWFGLGSEVDGESATTAPNGKVKGCAR